MNSDNSDKTEFVSWDSYHKFVQDVQKKSRYVWNEEVTTFLDTVIATNLKRDLTLKKGSTFFRAQRGNDWNIRKDEDGNVIDEELVGHDKERMKPKLDSAREGRTNPAGIPVLYLGSKIKTVISEVRPWIGSSVSVAQFKIERELKAIDLSHGYGKSSFSEVGFKHIINDTKPSLEEKNRAVWIDIDNAFSRPITLSDDSADYVPTQILAELFRDAGYDAIIYRSQFGEEGYNIVLFDLNDAKVINCTPYDIKEIDIKYKQAGNSWHSK